MSTFNVVKPGIGNVGSFQSSGVPWVSSSVVLPAVSGTPLEVSFPQVTKFVTVNNVSGNPLRVGFSLNGLTSTSNYFVVAANQLVTLDVKVVKLFLISDGASQATASLAAGLTGISSSELVNNWSGSAGVG